MQTPSERSIVHFDLDTFFVSVERQKDSRLEGKPIMVGGSGDRGVVAACSYEARQFGVRAGMAMRMARRLCPQATIVSGDHQAYTDKSQEITEIIHERAPLYEKASIDEFYLDVSGMERFHGTWQWANELRQCILKESGLPISMGLSVNKLVSKVAANAAKPNNQLQVPGQQVLDFLSPMPVSKLPMVGPKTALQLAHMGVRHVKVLRQIPRPALERAYGKQGTHLYQKARGQDDSPVTPSSIRKSISTERTFAADTMDVDFLRTTLIAMVEKLGFQLRQAQRLTGCISVRIRYANFDTVSKQIRIPFSARDDELILKALGLFEKLYTRRVRLRLIGVRLSRLAPGHPQLNLFEPLAKQADLYVALDRSQLRHGVGIVGRGDPSGMKWS